MSSFTFGEQDSSGTLEMLGKAIRWICYHLHPRPRRRKLSTFDVRRSESPQGSSHPAAAVNGRESSREGSFRVTARSPAVAPEAAKPVVVRVATFNASLFSMAPAIDAKEADLRGKAANDHRPRGILKIQTPEKSPKRSVSINLSDNEVSLERNKYLSTSSNEESPKEQKPEKSPKLRVSINLPDNEISLERSKYSSTSFREESSNSRSAVDFGRNCKRSVLAVLRELGADVVALQNVRAEEENAMKPLSDLAEGLGMSYVFAESWAPGYGDAVLSRFPIKRWRFHKICDDSDFRNLLKATVEVPHVGDLNVHCTHLDQLDEDWRMKQVKAILHVSGADGPHLLVGGLNSLDETDYAADRWNNIMKYYEEIGKPKPKADVMKLLKESRYTDAKDFAGECQAVVVAAKGQNVQGTCKYGTRVDYILSSPSPPFEFVPGSYEVVSSKGTSDHHIVKVDVAVTQARS